MTDNVASLPVKPCAPQPPPQHQFGEAVSVPKNRSLDRHPQTERTCKVCGAVKVTVHAPGGRAWREWRTSASSAQIETDFAPPCRPVSEGAP